MLLYSPTIPYHCFVFFLANPSSFIVSNHPSLSDTTPIVATDFNLRIVDGGNFDSGGELTMF